MLSKETSSTIFLWLDLGLNPGLLDHWQTVYSLGGQFKLVFFLFCFVFCKNYLLFNDSRNFMFYQWQKSWEACKLTWIFSACLQGQYCTNNFSCSGERHSHKKREYLGYDTKLHLMVRLHFWGPKVVVSVRVLSMGQIDLFKNYFYMIGFC